LVPTSFPYIFSLSIAVLLFFFQSSLDHRDLHSFPTRRSSDLMQKPSWNLPGGRVTTLLISRILGRRLMSPICGTFSKSATTHCLSTPRPPFIFRVFLAPHVTN